jgi:DNA-directed RNA polymerase specialized sigma24 family protein
MSPTIEDAHLLTAWQHQHDTEAFRVLCDRHISLVEAACRRQGSPDVAEAVQAVFLVLARRAGSVTGASLGGWLTTAAHRVVGHQHRSASNRRRHEQEAAVEQARHRAADGADPSWDEARQHLDTALASLSVSLR